MTEEEYRAPLIDWRAVPDGRELHVFPITFGRARLAITNRHDPLGYDAVF
jgi:hypothetical protein